LPFGRRGRAQVVNMGVSRLGDGVAFTGTYGSQRRNRT